MLAANKKDASFEYKDVTYDITEEGEDIYTISTGGTVLAMAAKDIITLEEGQEMSFNAKLEALKALSAGESSFSCDGVDYTLDADGNISAGGDDLGFISRLVVSPTENGAAISEDMREAIALAIEEDKDSLMITDENGEEQELKFTYNPSKKSWSVSQYTETYVYDRYSAPSKTHCWERILMVWICLPA